ncbi:MAG: transcriptional regulator, partial [Lysobacterales bacterium]
GLIEGEAHGRNISYRADFAAMNGLIEFLTHNCCGGDDSRCPPTSRGSAKRARSGGA